MANYRYTGGDERVFPHLSLTVTSGDIVDAAENPNPAYFELVSKAAPEKPSAKPATTTEE